MNAIETRSREIIRRLLVVPGATERLSVLTEWAGRLPAPHDYERVEANLVPGCVSRVWLASEIVDERIQFRADADSLLVKGLVALLWEIANNQMSIDLAEVPDEPGVLAALQLDRQLSPTRLNGAGRVWRRMRLLARQRLGSMILPLDEND